MFSDDSGYPGFVLDLIRRGSPAVSAAATKLRMGQSIDLSSVTYATLFLALADQPVDHRQEFRRHGAFGPAFVTADEVPPGAAGLRLQTRLNGEVMQNASTDDLVFDIATLVAMISEGITLAPGDLIVTGTPSGVGAARKPPVFMKPGEVCEVEIERVGLLRNPIVQET